MSLKDYWTHWTPLFPQYKHNNTVAIVGFAPTTRDAAPFENKHVDIWGLNEALEKDWFRCKYPAMWWQMHPVFDYMRKYNRNDPKHWKWLQKEYAFPIMMQNRYPEIPTSVPYPLKDAIDAFSMYFTSTPAYMLALAILMGYDRIEIYGIEMSADSEYIYQKAAFEYLIGFARGMGIEVFIPPKCSLLRCALYGYEDLRAASRVYYEMRLRDLRTLKDRKTEEVWEAIGGNNMLLTLLKNEGISAETKNVLAALVIEQESKINRVYQDYGAAVGSVKELMELISWHDSQSIPDDREDIPEEQWAKK